MTEPEQQRAFELARALAAEFAAVGAQHDRENSFPYALVDKFRASSLVALTVPKRFGGLGADIATFARCVEILATGDPACALAFNMHLAVIGFFRGMWSEAHQARYFTGVAQSGHLFDGAYSETRAGVIGLADTLAIPVAGGFRVNGKKTWATLSLAADFHTLNASITDENGGLPSANDARAAREVMLVCPATAPGVRIEHTWDAMGMRATGTETVVFDEVFIPESDVVSTAFRPGLFANLEWQTLSFASVYLGLARRAYTETLAIAAKKSLGAVLGANDVRLREQQRVQMGIGEMRLLLEAAANSIEVTAARLNRGQGLPTELESRLALLEMPKVLATENALRIVDIGMRLVGGGSYRRGHILERLCRDARSGPFHPLTTDQALELLGRTELQNAART
ncbi:MAG: acyl-CoA/acyl-ACP dehydrogenase [Gammaproteobacteria bacterium]|nr:acyl-CoA/acyl-ACP dehydrogenase [Gammaproteobacteria bacterium]